MRNETRIAGVGVSASFALLAVLAGCSAANKPYAGASGATFVISASEGTPALALTEEGGVTDEGGTPDGGTTDEGEVADDGTTTEEPAEPADEEAEDGEDAEDELISEADKADAARCGEAFSGVKNVLMVKGNRSEQIAQPTDLMIIKIAGNQNVVNVNIAAEEGQEDEDGEVVEPALGGICLIMSGNQAVANVSVSGFTLEKLVLHASGNNPQAKLMVGADAEVSSVDVTTRGNGGKLVVEGEGKFSCSEADVGGKSGGVEGCEVTK